MRVCWSQSFHAAASGGIDGYTRTHSATGGRDASMRTVRQAASYTASQALAAAVVALFLAR